MAMSPYSHKNLTKQQGKPCYLGIWFNACSDQERCQAGRASTPDFPRVALVQLEIKHIKLNFDLAKFF